MGLDDNDEECAVGDKLVTNDVNSGVVFGEDKTCSDGKGLVANDFCSSGAKFDGERRFMFVADVCKEYIPEDLVILAFDCENKGAGSGNGVIDDIMDDDARDDVDESVLVVVTIVDDSDIDERCDACDEHVLGRLQLKDKWSLLLSN